MDKSGFNYFKENINDLKGAITKLGLNMNELTVDLQKNTKLVLDLKEQVGINCKKLDGMQSNIVDIKNNISKIEHKMTHFIK